MTEPRDFVHIDDLEIGKTYRVEINDCCVVGEFTAVLVGKQYAQDDPERAYPTLTFGPDTISLSTAYGCQFTEAQT